MAAASDWKVTLALDVATLVHLMVEPVENPPAHGPAPRHGALTGPKVAVSGAMVGAGGVESP